MKKYCLVSALMNDESLKKLNTILGTKFNIIYHNPAGGKIEKFTDEEIENAEIIIGNPSAETLKKCKKLKWLQLNSSGADFYAKSGIIDPKATVLTNATGAYGHAIAEYLLAAVFMMTKKLHLYRDNQFAGKWQDLGAVGTIKGSNVLIVGLGDIGGQFGQMMYSLGADVYGIRRTVKEKPQYTKAVYSMDKLKELLPTADIVVLSLPNSRRTTHIIGEKELKLMKNTAILANVGRGTATDTQALTNALKNNEIGGAILDFTDPEPLPRDHPLWKMRNSVITPHISGGYHAKEIVENIQNIILTNAEKYINNQPLINLVDFETGYKKSE